ncbi:hypothetical protein [Citrifermentans bremense]|uniref:hypothetical protein n=1 Tax=Citrifermentans bremense TaxID=60035 RepID=UPI001626F5BA|nr:hypothetical protein [Citrifermentans bremense]
METLLNEMHNRVAKIDANLHRWKVFIAVATVINPGLCRDAFKIRPCRRRLRYIGHDAWAEPLRSQLNVEEDSFFKCGSIYFSVDFNGATYSIEGYLEGSRRKRIGLTYFEWLPDEAETAEIDLPSPPESS